MTYDIPGRPGYGAVVAFLITGKHAAAAPTAPGPEALPAPGVAPEILAAHKLNSAAVFGCLLVASLFGALFESWTVFTIVAAIMIAGALHDGSIRPNRRGS